ncbi:MAG: zinc ribbon domain-containing protein [Lachnospiraceae bacterium]|nr:zinc ribbon domain-containing protein [Lachnospiraceae bacterium]
MYCSNCGSQVGDNEKFCANCGTPVNVQAAPVVQAAPTVQQPAPQPMPQAVPQAVPAPANVKAGPRRACFVVGLITCILLIIETAPVFVLGGMMFVFGPIAMALFGADTGDLFVTGLLVCLGGFILMDAAIVSIVFNGICTKITAKRPASKCRTLRMAAAIMTSVDAAIVIAPVIGLNNMMDDAQFFYGIFAVTFIMAIVFLVLAIITNSKEKKLASA